MLPDCDKTGAQIGLGAEVSAAGADHLNVEVTDLLAQRVPIDPKQIGRAKLIAAGRRQRNYRLRSAPGGGQHARR